MPRRARLDAEGALHHVIVRGINRADLFADDIDRKKFLERLGEVMGETGFSVHAFAIMRNHVHILVRSGATGLSAAMRKLLTWYAIYFNRRHRRQAICSRIAISRSSAKRSPISSNWYTSISTP
jgi:putative transposase